MCADDVVVPCDEELWITGAFEGMLHCEVDHDENRGWVKPRGSTPPPGFARHDRSPFLLEGTDSPRVWLFNSAIPTGMLDGEALTWLQSGLSALFSTIQKFGHHPIHGRQRRLITIPLVGVGAGGFTQIRGETIRGILGTLSRCAARQGHSDIALVTWRRSDYAAVQKSRPAFYPPTGSAGEEHVERLARLTRSGQLVVFMGAGVSRSAGLPDWKELLERLAAKTSWAGNKEMRESVLALPPEDAAQVLSQSLTSEGLQELIVEMLRHRTRFGLSHSLLASMRLPEAVTTNYDDLYEIACERPHDGQLRVLPRQGLDSHRSWLLKLHGDIAKPDTIILTRSQYFAFDTDSAPLASVVQAGMVTRQMLFVGYSVSDLNFIRLAYQVRALFKKFQLDDGIGTVITLAEKPADQALWEDSLNYVAVPGNTSEAARNVEILLDCIAHRACDEAPYLLDKRYEGVLDEDERLLSGVLKKLAASVKGDGPSARAVHRLLRELGHRPLDDGSHPVP